MTSPIEPRTASLYHASRSPAVEPGTAAAIVAAAVASYLVASAVVPAGLSFVVAQLALAVVASLAVALAVPRRAGAALGLGRARPRFFVAAIAVGATAWYVHAWLVDWLAQHLPVPRSEIRHLEGLVERPGLLPALAMFAVLPALCEEIVFRGVLARSLGRRASLVGAAAISAVVFAAYHLSIVQALPTLSLGLLLGIIAIRADSAVPTMLAHAINNALAIALSRGELPAAAEWLAGHPMTALGGCAATTACGIAIAAWPRS